MVDSGHDNESKQKKVEARISKCESNLGSEGLEKIAQNRAAVDEYEGKEIPRPDFWGGFAIEVNYWEFWQGRRNRTHDRFCYKPEDNSWKIERMSP